eukprot:2767192-Rhodomonas_salina.1
MKITVASPGGQVGVWVKADAWPAAPWDFRGSWDQVRGPDLGWLHEEGFHGHSLADVPLSDGVLELAVEGARVAVGCTVDHDVEVVVEEPGSCQTVGAELALLEEGLLEVVGQCTDFFRSGADGDVL